MSYPNSPLSILNIGLDRELLQEDFEAEALVRQVFYAKQIPAHLTHIVKAPVTFKTETLQIVPNVKVVACPVKHWSKFVVAAYQAGHKILSEGGFDIIQVQEPFVSGLAGAWLAKKFNLPLVVGLYSDEIDNPLWVNDSLINRVANFIGKKVLRKASAIRCDSQTVANRLVGGPYRYVQYIPFLITHAERLTQKHPHSEQLRADILGGSSGPLLLSVCRLEQEKNISMMLQSFAMARKEHPGLVLAIAGDGTLRNELREQSKRLAPESVRWLGWVNNADIPAYYQAADLFLLSSRRESAARVLIESLLAGTPILTTDTAGAREVVEEGVTGKIVPIDDLDAFFRGLLDLCQNQNLARMGSEGRKRMASWVTGSAVVEQMRLLYQQALGTSQ